MSRAFLLFLGKATITSTTVPVTDEYLYSILNQGRSEAAYVDFLMNCLQGEHFKNLG